MSFTSDIKKELADISSISVNYHNAMLYGILYSLKPNLRFSTEIKDAVNLYKKLILRFFPQISFSEKNGRFKIIEPDESSKIKIKNSFFYSDNKVDRAIIDGSDECSSAFLRGIFIVCGWVSSPEKEYHLEITLPDNNKAESIYNIMNEHGLNAKKAMRKKSIIIYQKESEAIEDFLTFIGASGFSMEIMSAKIYKDFRNKVNRTINCESANLDKTINAAAKQIEAIKTIFEIKGENYLDPQLYEVAKLRIDNIDMSLREIGELLSPPISRSGVYHRLKKICEIAEGLK